MDNVADVHTTTLMLNHLHDLMSDVTEHSWDNVRNCHAIILQQMEQGRITWEDERRLRELRHTYAHARARGSGEPSMQNLRAPVFCNKFQDGECPYDHDHNTSRGFVPHICAYCLKHTGFAYKHPWIACQRKQRDQSKNGKQYVRFQTTPSYSHVHVKASSHLGINGIIHNGSIYGIIRNGSIYGISHNGLIYGIIRNGSIYGITRKGITRNGMIYKIAQNGINKPHMYTRVLTNKSTSHMVFQRIFSRTTYSFRRRRRLGCFHQRTSMQQDERGRC